jgi:hypothetical protein
LLDSAIVIVLFFAFSQIKKSKDVEAFYKLIHYSAKGGISIKVPFRLRACLSAVEDGASSHSQVFFFGSFLFRRKKK